MLNNQMRMREDMRGCERNALTTDRRRRYKRNWTSRGRVVAENATRVRDLQKRKTRNG